MPRLLGVDIPNDRKTVISLTYLYGVGGQTARDLCHKAGVDQDFGMVYMTQLPDRVALCQI